VSHILTAHSLDQPPPYEPGRVVDESRSGLPISAGIASAQLGGTALEDRDEFLGHLVGDWILTGEMGEVELRQEVRSKWVLCDTFVRMHFRSVTPVSNPTSNYEAIYHIGYNGESQTYVLHLLDTTEVPLVCVMGHGTRNGNTVPFVFEYAETKFVNTFAWDPNRDTWRFLQTYEEGGALKTFASKEMKRSPV
jgi:hypothetical protein